MSWQLQADTHLLCWGGLCSWGGEQAHLHLQVTAGVKCGCIPAAVAEVSSNMENPRTCVRGVGKQQVNTQIGVYGTFLQSVSF